MKTARQVSERDIAIQLVLELAEDTRPMASFSMLGAYDDDATFISSVAFRCECKDDRAFQNKMRRVVRVLETCGVLIGRVMSTHKEYIGEPTHQKNYWLRPGKAELIRRPAKLGVCMGAQGETEFLLRHAYPDPERYK